MWPFWQEMSEEIGTRGFEKSQGVGSQNWESSSFGVATNIEKIVIAASDVHARNKHLWNSVFCKYVFQICALSLIHLVKQKF